MSDEQKPSRRALLAGTALLSAEILPYVRPARGQTPNPTPVADGPITFDDLADAEFQPAIFESGENSLAAVHKLYLDTWPVVAVMVLALQKDHHGMARFANLCPDDDFKAIVEYMQSAQSYFRNLADLMDTAELRTMAGAHRLMKERGA